MHDEDYMPSNMDSNSDDNGSYTAEPPHPVPGVDIYHDGPQPFHGDDSEGSSDDSDWQ